MDFQIDQRIKSATLEATVIREDGTRIPLGVVAAYHQDPRGFRQLLKRLGGRVGRINLLKFPGA